MKNYKTADDIFREKEDNEREFQRKRVVKDINKSLDDVFGSRKKQTKGAGLLKFLFILLLILFLINFILGNIWLLKLFIKDLF
ncbi:hypothetical protein COU57_06485 [Candidatus Pacearchaeota archaeon CG10_big_fil_rev_8_21_14_0_10_32_14]|nr:MAG: hypothetical protein COU57_06485 [Candidatus Pacearchaeota archaeon CG10_big_fil_rev_8_21_14_0_10_32_14]